MAGGSKDIAIEESADGGIIVAGIEIVITRFGVIEIAAVADGVGTLGEAVDFAGGVVDLELDGLVIVLPHPDQITAVVIIELGGAPEAGHPASGMVTLNENESKT